MERLTIPDEKIEGGVRRTVVDTRKVKEHAMTIYWALKKYEDTASLRSRSGSWRSGTRRKSRLLQATITPWVAKWGSARNVAQCLGVT